MLGECSASIGNWVEETIVLFLFRTSTQTMGADIGMQYKLSLKIGVGQDRCGGQELFHTGRNWIVPHSSDFVWINLGEMPLAEMICLK